MGFEEIWDSIVDGLEYIFTFEWIGDIGEFFGNAWEMVTDLGNSPLTNIWFWLFYAALFISLWILPSKLGLADYTMGQKLLYTVIFFVLDWVIISQFMD